MLNLIESFKKIKGIGIAEYQIVETEKELEKFEFPYYLKASVPAHKTEESAVARCRNLKEAKEKFRILKKKFSDFKIIMQKEILGVEMIIGLKTDDVFGKIFMIGFGGIHAESMNDVSFRALPVSKYDIEEMLHELKGFESLVSRKKYAVDKFISAAEKASNIDVDEMDINPVIVNEKEAVAVDARIL